MYSLSGDYPESPAESEESITDEIADNDGGFAPPSPYGSGSSRGATTPKPTLNTPPRRESTGEKQRKWAVRTFTVFLVNEGISKAIEEMTPNELNRYLKKFYKKVKRKDGCDFSKSGLINIRNALDRYIKTNLNFTILKCTEFEEANKAFDQKIATMEGNAASPWRNSLSINPQDMQKILSSGVIGGSEPNLLLRACWFNICLHFDVGDHLKQRRLSKQQLVVHCDATGQEHVKLVSFPYQQTLSGNTSLPTTMHSVPGHPLCPVALLKKYISKLHPESDALFQCPVQYNVDDSVPVWYEKQAVGVHALEGMMSCISREAGLSRIYSNGCLRKSSSLVYLQCGFGYDPRNITSESSMAVTNPLPTSSSTGSAFSPSQDRVPPLPSPSVPSPQCSSAEQFNFPVESKHIPLYHTSTTSQQQKRYENISSSAFSQFNNTPTLTKTDNYQNSKGSQQFDAILPRTAIGVCMPTIKIEDGVSSLCDGSSMGVQPTFPSESIDFPSVTETFSNRREMYRNSASNEGISHQPYLNQTDLSNKTYIHLELLSGKSFIDFELYESGHPVPSLVAHVHFRGQRFKTISVPCCTNPIIKQDFFLELVDKPTTDNNTLLAITEPIELILSKTEHINQNTTLIGLHSFYWHTALKEPSNMVTMKLDINGMGEENKMMIGSLEVRLKILTNCQQVLQSHVIESHLSDIHSKISEREMRFMSYARQWWKEFLSSCPSHSRQKVKIFAQSECGASKPVVTFIKPIEAGRLLEGPRHAARFVSLIKHEEECSMFGNKVENWSSLHAFLCRGKGSCEDHALLLCSILLGFGLDAYVCLGTKDTGQAHAWVMTRHHGGKIAFWESLTGQRYDLASSHQYRTLACLLSNRRFFANIQSSGLISNCDFDVNNKAMWKSMDPVAIETVCGPGLQPPVPVPPSLQQSSVNCLIASRKFEQELRAAIQDYRQGTGLAVHWDDRLSNILSPCLAANESQAKNGHAVNADELHETVYQYLSRKMSFDSVTTCINHVQVSQAITDIQSFQEFHAIIDCNKEGLRFALRAQIFSYPEDICACWVIVAAVYPDGKPTCQWKVAKLHNNL